MNLILYLRLESLPIPLPYVHTHILQTRPLRCEGGITLSFVPLCLGQITAPALSALPPSMAVVRDIFLQANSFYKSMLQSSRTMSSIPELQPDARRAAGPACRDSVAAVEMRR